MEAGVPDFLCPPPRRREVEVDFLLLVVVASWLIRWWGAPAREGLILLEGRVGPAEEPREAVSRPLGVPGPRDD